MDNLSEIGARIKQIRGLLTQKQFAESLGVARTYVSNIEYGRVKPSLEFLINVAKSYHVSLDWLLLGHDPSTIYQKNQDTLLLEWIQLFDNITPDAKSILLGTVKTILENGNLSNNPTNAPLTSPNIEEHAAGKGEIA